MTNPDANRVLSDYEKRVATLLEKAEEAKAQIRDLTGTATSQDGAVTLTVSAAGAGAGHAADHGDHGADHRGQQRRHAVPERAGAPGGGAGRAAARAAGVAAVQRGAGR